MFGTLGGPELFLIFVVALIVFGPRKLPDIGKSLGKMMSEFRRASNDFRSTIESEVESERIRESMRIEPPKVEKVKTGTSPAEPGSTAPSPGDEEESETEPGAPPSPETSAPDPGFPDSSPGPEEGTPSEPSSASPDQPVPTTVSRQPPPASESK